MVGPGPQAQLAGFSTKGTNSALPGVPQHSPIGSTSHIGARFYRKKT